ncbi:basic helix-loop-helix protein [Tilletia horrida]|nr:basic helix-loop-helix protein [Tilletia horrida]KAK0560901.1 basic helix-loop-helix protein [Tilletia horrida]
MAAPSHHASTSAASHHTATIDDVALLAAAAVSGAISGSGLDAVQPAAPAAEEDSDEAQHHQQLAAAAAAAAAEAVEAAKHQQQQQQQIQQHSGDRNGDAPAPPGVDADAHDISMTDASQNDAQEGTDLGLLASVDAATAAAAAAAAQGTPAAPAPAPGTEGAEAAHGEQDGTQPQHSVPPAAAPGTTDASGENDTNSGGFDVLVAAQRAANVAAEAEAHLNAAAAAAAAAAATVASSSSQHPQSDPRGIHGDNNAGADMTSNQADQTMTSDDGANASYYGQLLPANGSGGPGAGHTGHSGASSSGRGSKRKRKDETMEGERARKDSHKEVERRRRAAINAGLDSLAEIVPGSGDPKSANKNAIIASAVTYIRELKENEAASIEKWTLEKLLMDQALADITVQLEEKKRECEQLRLALVRAGQALPPEETGGAGAGAGEGDVSAAAGTGAQEQHDAAEPPPTAPGAGAGEEQTQVDGAGDGNLDPALAEHVHEGV